MQRSLDCRHFQVRNHAEIAGAAASPAELGYCGGGYAALPIIEDEAQSHHDSH